MNTLQRIVMGLALLAMVLAGNAQPIGSGVGSPAAPATQAEVNAGTVRSKFVSPATLAGVIVPTNVFTATFPAFSDVTNIVNTALASSGNVLATQTGSNLVLLTTNQMVISNLYAPALVGAMNVAAYVSQAFGNDSNPPPGPYKTLPKADAVAGNGLIYVRDGSYTNTLLTNANWYFESGVFLNGGNLGTFAVPNSSVFQVSGWASVTNVFLSILNTSNAVCDIEIANWKSAGANFITANGSMSNVVNVRFKLGQNGGAGSALVTASDQGVAPNLFNFFSYGDITCLPTTKPMTNTAWIVTIRTPRFLQGGNGMWGAAGNRIQARVRIEGGSYSMNGFVQAAANMGTNIWFKNVSLFSTNDWGLDNATNTHGIFFYETERLVYTNP